MKKAAIGKRNKPIPRKGRLSASEIIKAVPIGDVNWRKKKPTVIIKKVRKNNRISTATKVPINSPAFVNIFFAGLRIVEGN